MKKLLLVSAAVAGLMTASIAYAQDAQNGEQAKSNNDNDAVVVIGKRAKRISSGATGLPLDIKDTPQSISLITEEQMKNFGANSVNDALRLGTGINVEEWETNRTNYMSRGFDIINTQVDGTGMPNNWGIVTGAFDSYGYNKIEIIRGANGLLTGVGNSSGTINYVRKRPTNTDGGEINLYGGSYDMKRIEGDYNKVLTKDGKWAARLVAAYEDKNSYLQYLTNDRSYIYGVVDGQIGENGVLTIGYSYQKTHSNGVMWGALSYDYSDGTQAEWDTDATTTQRWTYWDTINQTAFVEYTHKLSDNWEAKISYNYNHSDEDAKLFYAYTSGGLNADNTGLYGYPYWGPTESESNLYDASLKGKFGLFGRQHDLILGVSYSDGEVDSYYYPTLDYAAFGALPAFPYSQDTVAEPLWGEKSDYSTENNKRARLYIATRLELSDRLKAIIGLNAIKIKRTGGSRYSSADNDDYSQKEDKVSPYAGITYDFTKNILGYISYSDIYQNQDQSDYYGHFLPSMKGVNYEAGVKAEWLNRRLLTTFAIFKAEQEGLATYAGFNEVGNYYYVGVDVDSKGVEFEATGRINKNTNVVLGITHLELKGNDDEDVYNWVPRTTVNFMVDTKFAALPNVTFGLGGKWQSDIYNYADSGNKVSQDSYILLNGFANIALSEQSYLRINVNNITDKKYISSLYSIGYYGAPRNYTVSVGYKF